MLAANIARPARFESNPFWAGAGTGPSDLRTSIDPKCRDLAAEYAWPPLLDIPLARTYKWLLGLPGFDRKVGAGPVGRAVAALSYVALEEEHAEMVWPLVGLEALYGRGKEGLQRQLLEKSEVFLGRRKAFKQKFQDMYDVRSRFLHGDMDLPFAHAPDFATDEHEAFDEASEHTAALSTAILVASLQKLVMEDRYDFEFKYARVEEP
jgi:hypothetical protein